LSARAAVELDLYTRRFTINNRGTDAHLVDLIRMLPCVLHLENRVLEKWLNTLLEEIDKQTKGKRSGNGVKVVGSKAWKQQKFEAFEKYVREEVLGTADRGQVRCALPPSDPRRPIQLHGRNSLH
jgi:hypothetical protein